VRVIKCKEDETEKRCFVHKEDERVFFKNRQGKGKGKGKVHPRTGHEGPEGE
jgi:hypothetical protein